MDDDVTIFVWLGVAFIIFGLILNISCVARRFKKRKGCTEIVQATCIRLEKMSENEEIDPEEREMILEEEAAEEQENQIDEVRVGLSGSPPGTILNDPTQPKTAVAPVYEYSILGQKHQVRSRVYSYPSVVRVGEIRQLYVDPQNPKRFFDPKEDKVAFFAEISASLVAILVGALLVAVIFIYGD